ncbi:MAG: RNase adapter RapZ [Desulfovibrionaceae bacterium]|nr:RNase adapter RapZ [Desulfovibrionaceae bacterium]
MAAEAPALNADGFSFPTLILAGLSGAGKSSVLNVFEDLRFFTIDGLPLELVGDVLPLLNTSALARYQGVIIGVDLRQCHSDQEFLKQFSDLRGKSADLRLIFLDADTEAIIRRYAATRRPHPLEAEGLGLEEAVAEERQRFARLRHLADLALDTTAFSIHDLRRKIQAWAGRLFDKKPQFRVHLISFGFKYGLPVESDMMYDLRFLPNPYFVEDLSPLNGLDQPIIAYVLGSDPGRTFISRLADFMAYFLPLFEVEGRYRLTIAFGCTGGQHRSVAVSEAAGKILRNLGFAVSIEHRHLKLGLPDGKK